MPITIIGPVEDSIAVQLIHDFINVTLMDVGEPDGVASTLHDPTDPNQALTFTLQLLPIADRIPLQYEGKPGQYVIVARANNPVGPDSMNPNQDPNELRFTIDYDTITGRFDYNW